MALSRTRSVRLIDIARRARVSASVVSTVLGSGTGNIRVATSTAERIRRIAKQLNYQPNVAARLLKGQRSGVLGVLIGAESTAANYERLSAIEQAAYARGYRLMVGQFRGESDRTAEYVQDFLSRGIDGMICFHNPLPRHDRKVIDLLSRIPHLVFQTEALVSGACCVDVDRAAGVRQAIGHLLDTGRRRIALVLNDMKDRLMRDRMDGYVAGLRDRGIEVDAKLVFAGDGTFPPPGLLLDSAVQHVVIDARADAIIASNDIWAIGLIKSIRRRALRVPKDVAVVGFDNLPAAALFDPELTSIDQNNEAFAAAAVWLLLESMEKGKLPAERRKVIVQPRLVVRGTT